MTNPVISVEHLSKTYRLGQISSGTLSHDINVWWAKVRGKPNPMLKIDQADYGNRDGELLWALRDVSFSVGRGEVLGIIGRNGAGKSTLLKILARVTAPTSGKVKVKGRIASLLEVGTGFHPDLTGRENIYLNGAILGMNRGEIKHKFDEIIAFAEINKFIDTPVKRYSSGMYVRLAFAVAAHLEPEILLVDEVLAVGDAGFQKKCLGKMSDVAKEGRTVLFVTHNMVAASRLCTQGILMEAGKAKVIAGAEEVIRTYQQSLEDQANLPLDKRTDRSGTGVLRFIGVHFQNEDREEISVIESGQPLRLVIDYKVLSKSKLENVVVNANFVDMLGQRLFTVGIRLDEDSEQLPPDGSLICSFPQLMLAEEQYRIDLWAAALGSEADFIERATLLRVTSDKELARRKLGYFVMPHEWKISNNK